MRNSITALFITMVLSSAPAVADDAVNVTVVTKVTSRYVLQDLGVEASDRPGVVTVLAVSKDVAIIKGRLTFDWWQRADATDEGEYGDRGFGDEHDLTVTYNRQFGTFAFEASAAYYFLAPLGGKNDGVQLYTDLGRTFELGHGVTVTPALRAIEFIGLDAMSSFTQIRYRMPIAVPIPGLTDVSVVFDPSVTATVTRGPEHNWVFRPTGSVVWKATELLTIQLDGKGTNFTGTEVDLGLACHF